MARQSTAQATAAARPAKTVFAAAPKPASAATMKSGTAEQTKRATDRTAMRRATKVSLWAAALAGFSEFGINNVFASTMLMVAAPVTATAFVYQISAMRTSTLAYEAADRANYAAAIEANTKDATDRKPRNVAATDQAAPDMVRKLDAMLSSRAVLLDTFGDDPSAVAPVYVRIIKQLLHDDEDTFATLAERKNVSDDPTTLAEKETQLRDVHVKLSRLAGT